MTSLYESLTAKQRERRAELLQLLAGYSVLKWNDPGEAVPDIPWDSQNVTTAMLDSTRAVRAINQRKRDVVWNELGRIVHELREQRLVTLAELTELRGDLSHNDIKGLLASPKPKPIRNAVVTEMRELAMRQTRDNSAGPGYRSAELQNDWRSKLTEISNNEVTRKRRQLIEWLRARHPRLSPETFAAIERGEHERA